MKTFSFAFNKLRFYLFLYFLLHFFSIGKKAIYMITTLCTTHSLIGFVVLIEKHLNLLDDLQPN